MFRKVSPFRRYRVVLLLAVLGVAAGGGFYACQQAARAAAIVTLRPGAVIAAEGDSLTYGADFSRAPDGTVRTRSATPYPESLATDLGPRVTVENRGFNGDRTIDGLMRWQHAGRADLVVLMYGTNDCGNLSHGGAEGLLTVETYRAMMKVLIERRQAAGAAVIVLVPPPIADAGVDEKMKPYRVAVTEVAHERHVPVIDTAEALRGIDHPWSDGLHLTPEAYQAVAAEVARHIQVK